MIGADLTDILGSDRAVHTHDEARRVIEAMLELHRGPCPEAYAEVLSVYVAATDHGRANLFLEAALRAFGPQPAPVPKPNERTDDRVSVATAWDADGRTVIWRFLTPEEGEAMDANKAARSAEADEKAARDRAFTEAFERIAAQGADHLDALRSARAGSGGFTAEIAAHLGRAAEQRRAQQIERRRRASALLGLSLTAAGLCLLRFGCRSARQPVPRRGAAK